MKENEIMSYNKIDYKLFRKFDNNFRNYEVNVTRNDSKDLAYTTAWQHANRQILTPFEQGLDPQDAPKVDYLLRAPFDKDENMTTRLIQLGNVMNHAHFSYYNDWDSGELDFWASDVENLPYDEDDVNTKKPTSPLEFVDYSAKRAAKHDLTYIGGYEPVTATDITDYVDDALTGKTYDAELHESFVRDDVRWQSLQKERDNHKNEAIQRVVNDDNPSKLDIAIALTTSTSGVFDENMKAVSKDDFDYFKDTLTTPVGDTDVYANLDELNNTMQARFEDITNAIHPKMKILDGIIPQAIDEHIENADGIGFDASLGEIIDENREYALKHSDVFYGIDTFSSDEMLNRLKNGYSVDLDRPLSEERKASKSSTSTMNPNYMAGKQVELYATKFAPRTYRTAEGEVKSAVFIQAKKRGDIDDQKTRFDGDFVTNRRLNSGALNHTQVITNETAKKILAVNGFDMKDVGLKSGENKGYDFAQTLINNEKPLTFKANVFAPEGAKYGDFNFNPNPEQINPSDKSLDVETMKHFEEVRKQEHQANKNASKIKQQTDEIEK